MTSRRDDATYKAQGVELMWRQTKPARLRADEFGVPRQTLYRWQKTRRPSPMFWL